MPSDLNIPLATYRLQFHHGFTLREAAALVPYLESLGISHVYASPLLKTCPGSTHGYDVCDPSQINPELGTEMDLEALVRALRERDMGLVLDIVPNHVGVADGANPWWQDVLRRGRASSYAKYFDIDWNSPDPELHNKVLLPVLGDDYERVLGRRELQLVLNKDIVTLGYFEHRFPLTPGSLPSLGAPAEAGLRDLNENPEALDAVIRRQHYRLVHWKRGDAELNYRRFFSITSLAGVRVETESVFSAAHVRVRDWLSRGFVDGLRVDHPDGLRDPAEYLQRLRQLAPKAWIVIEKILEPGELLPTDWPVAGTTGYDFLNRVGGLLVDPAGEAALTAFYSEFTGEPTDYPAILIEKKRRVLLELFGTEVSRLTRILQEIASRTPQFAALTSESLRDAIIELATAFPVYRSYIRAGDQQVSAADRSHIEEALAKAHAGRPDLGTALEFVGELLKLCLRGESESDFVMRFQQLTGPAMAKGAEDTAFYCFNRFVALNEVGGDPSRFGLRVEEFHQACQEARQRWPGTMLATSTHDTKRSEDVRARLALLSEIPDRWTAAIRRWSVSNEKHRRQGWPDRNVEYLIYQSLIGAWPLSLSRALACFEKSSREAKQHTSWSDRNADYEAALKDFVTGILSDRDFVGELEQFVAPLAPAGFVNSLAQTLLKLTAPGVPDIYQGTDLWDFSLVDPDNRRPVDFALRRASLNELRRNVETSGVQQLARELQPQPADGRIKQFLIHRTLQFRRKHEQLISDGEYLPLLAMGARVKHVCAFARTREDQMALTVVPRLVLGLVGERSSLPLDPTVWDDTRLHLPQAATAEAWRNVLTGEILRPRKNGAGPWLSLAEVLGQFPVALLEQIARPHEA